METEGLVGVGGGRGIGAMAGRRMSLWGGIPIDELGSSDDSGRDAADTWLVSLTDPVCQMTPPPITQ